MFFLLDPRIKQGQAKRTKKSMALKKFFKSSSARFIKICKLVAQLGELRHTNFGHFASLRTAIKIF